MPNPHPRPALPSPLRLALDFCFRAAVVSLACFAFAGLAARAQPSGTAQPQGTAAGSPESRVIRPGSIRAIPTAAVASLSRIGVVSRAALTADETSASMPFEVGLRMHSFDELQARLARGEQISPAEMASKYFPKAADHDRVVQWLKSQGFEITRTDSNHLAIFGRGAVRAVAQAFQVTFARVTANGAEYTSAITAPSLPASISSAVAGIHGLQPHLRPHRLSTRRPIAAPRASPGNSPPYLPAQIAQVYNANGLSQTGSGQTIALYELAFPQTSDLASFWSTAGVNQSTSNVAMISVNGGPGSSPGTENLQEASLDVEWAGAMAPGATLRVYGANENDPANNDEILQQVYADLAAYPGMHQLSICIGGNEQEIERDYLVLESQFMATLASAGVSVFSASGDQGATVDGILQTTYPTSDPDVTGVGGTSLTLNSSGGVASETGWSGSGGGISAVFSRPPWQTGTGVPSGTMRLVPDVAAAADPNLGAVVIINGHQNQVGGTSWSTPVWTAFCALINQKRSSAGQAPLGLLNAKIYPLLETSSFRDIISGSNSGYTAGTGYDLVTGLGVPDVSALLQATLSSTAAPIIAGQLGSPFATLGQPATLFVTAEGAATLSYQWQRRPNGSSTWVTLSDDATYSGAATATLVVTGTTAAVNGDQFECIVTNSAGSATSPAATLTVNPVGVTTFAGWPGDAGSVDGTGWAARFSYPGAVRTDTAGNVYVADSENNTLRKITLAGAVTTMVGTAGVTGSADGTGAAAQLNGPGGVAVDSAGNLYIADTGNYTIRKVTPAGVVTTLAGTAGSRGETDGTGSAAQLYDPQNLAVDRAGNLYVADGQGNDIRKVTPAGVVTTLAGSQRHGSVDATGSAAGFNDPSGIAVDAAGNVYVADTGNNAVRVVTPAGAVTTLAGTAGVTGSSDGTGGSAQFNAPAGVAVDLLGNVYVADSGNDTIRQIAPGGATTTVAGSPGVEENIDGLAANARFWTPGDIAIDGSGVLYVADTYNFTIRRVIPGAAAASAIAAGPAAATVSLGSSATFSVAATGTAPLSYQWTYNGAALAGATAASYTLSDAQQADEGSYAVTVTNAEGAATSAGAALTVTLPAGYPNLTSQPQNATVTFDGSTTLSIAVTGTGPFIYQWSLDGAVLDGATAATYVAAAPGTYTVAVTNAIASTTSSPAVVTAANRLINVSSRTLVQTGGGITIAGFVIEGPAGSTKQVLIRGVGPTLANYGLTGLLAQPSLALFDGSGAEIASNTGWLTSTNPAAITSVAAQVGAFAFNSGSADSALIATLSPGAYSAQLTGAGSTTGVGLVEVYEVNSSDSTVLANISTRAEVGTGSNILIAGFVVRGSQPVNVLIRAVGPTLVNFGVASTLVLPAPALTVFDSTGAVVASNTGWGTASNASAVASTAAAVGAFALPSGSADSALLLTLPPGSYSAQVSGVGGATGIALVEVYQAPP